MRCAGSVEPAPGCVGLGALAGAAASDRRRFGNADALTADDTGSAALVPSAEIGN